MTDLRLLFLAAALVECAVPAPARGLSVNATFNDPGGSYSAYYDRLRGALEGAALTWAAHLEVHPAAVVDVEFSFDNIATAGGVPRGYLDTLRTVGTIPIYEPEIAVEIRTGQEFRPGLPEGKITLGIDYVVNRFWYDPDPVARTAPVPAGMIDAVSTVTHELGHILGYTGWHNRDTSALGAVATPYDALLYRPTGSDFPYFTGANAVGAYGGPVPLTAGNSAHLGNAAGMPGDDLLHTLMNGVVGRLGARRWPTPMDFAVLADLGYTATLDTFIEGDLNGDNVVDAADYTVYRDTLGETGVDVPGDANLDRVVNEADLAAWRDDYGQQVVLNPLSTPEPGTSLLVALAGPAAGIRRKRFG